jgi:gliding motility-associated-like protein
MKINRHIATLALLFLLFPVFGQENLIRNGSFEGVTGDYFPQYWMVCHGEAWNDPTCATNRYGIIPVDDSPFMYLKARGKTYDDINKDPIHPKITREFLIQELEKPLEKYTNYMFSVYLTFSEIDFFYDIDPDKNNTAYPLKLEIWAGNDSCNQNVLLKTTPVIRYETWVRDTFTFNTMGETYKYLKVIPQWDKSISPDPYNGSIMLDDMRLEKDDCLYDSSSVDVYFKGDNLTQLKAPFGGIGSTYTWSPKENLSNYSVPNPIVTKYTNIQRYTVKVKTTEKCPLIHNINLIFNCDSMYHNRIKDTIMVYYKNSTKVYLTATKGVSYLWEPSTYLSSTTVQSTYLTKYSEQFKVTVTDKYQCEFNQFFKVIVDCDTLNPEKEIITLDTTVSSGEIIQLQPKYGNINGSWNPATFLECSYCQSTKAAPISEINYRVALLDEQNCSHTEIFKIKIELQIPNFISPNNDGYNDCFNINGLPERTTLVISDKTGKVIFSVYPYTYENCWAGLDKNGNKVETGTYWYSIESPYLISKLKGFVFVKE